MIAAGVDRLSLAGQRVLVTGATGMLGQAVVARLRAAGALVGITSRHPPATEDMATFSWDLAREAAPKSLADWQPAFVVHAAAATDVDRCEREPAWAQAINADGTARVVDLATRVSARFLYVSTDSVFRGDREWYADTDQPEPVNVYAATKLAGERSSGQIAQSLSVRLNMIGNAPGRLTDWILQTAAAGLPLRVFTDVVFNPVDILTLAGMLVGLLNSTLTGVCHVGADEAISKADYAERLVRYAGFAARATIERVPLATLTLSAPRPLNTSLMPSRGVQSLFRTPSLDDAMRRLAADFRLRSAADPSRKRSS